VLSGWGVELTYDTTSFGGQRQLSYQGTTFAGERIEVTKLGAHEVGEIATVTLEDGIADGPIVYLSLLVPSVVPAAGPTPIRTRAIQTTLRRVGTGQRQTYSVLELEGTAETVEF
jgi:hypothetical protein